MSLYYCCQAPHIPFLRAPPQLPCHSGSCDWGQPACKILHQYVLAHRMLNMAVQARELMCHQTVQHIPRINHPEGISAIKAKC